MTQLHIRQMLPSDLDLALTLRGIAGWNQTPADILRLVNYEPEGCFVAEWAGQAIGTASTTTYGTDLAWIGLMLVHPDYRRRGIATALMEACLDYLSGRDVTCIKLDASPDGLPVYEKLGFRSESEIHRWERAGTAVSPVRIAGAVPTPLLQLDSQAFGTSRDDLIRQMDTESLTVSTSDGFGMARTGTRASYIGPVVSESESTAQTLCTELLSQLTGPVFQDIFEDNAPAVEMAESNGFERVRLLTRMWTGERQLPTRTDLQYALADPTTG